MVPWPSASFALSVQREHMFTCATSRLPKSARAWTPESTIAIAGAFGVGPVISPVFGANAFCRIVMSVESCQIVLSWYADVGTGTFEVISEMYVCRARFSLALTLMLA